MKWAALKVRRLFDQETALTSREAVRPGALTQSICSPWQTDFVSEGAASGN